jgi:hypothetical protein
MHTDLAWQRTIDRQSSLRREARSWRLCVRPGDVDPTQLLSADRADHSRMVNRRTVHGAAER